MRGFFISARPGKGSSISARHRGLRPWAQGFQSWHSACCWVAGSGLLEMRPTPREAVMSFGNECWAWLAGEADRRLGDLMSFCFSPKHGGEVYGLSFSLLDLYGPCWVRSVVNIGKGDWDGRKKSDHFLLDLESNLNIEILTSDTNLQAALSCSLASGLLLLSAFMLQHIPLFGGIQRSDYCKETSVRLAAFVSREHLRDLYGQPRKPESGGRRK